MKKWLWVLLGFCLIPLWVQAKHHKAGEAHNWPHWRGPNANGLVEDSNPPLEWSESENIRWKVKLPGLLGHATPIVWGDKIFVQTAVKTDKTVDAPQTGNRRPPMPNVLQFKVLALNRKTGNTVWEKTVQEAAPHEGIHQTASYASTSGITDGEHLYAFFGSWGIYCFDFDGNLKWGKDLGDQKIAGSFGEGSAPALHGNTLIIKWDHQGDSFIVAMDKRTGEELWRKDRPERTTWTTPFHRGARWHDAGDRQRDPKNPQLRPQNRRHLVGMRGLGGKRHSHAGLCQRHRLRHQRASQSGDAGHLLGQSQRRHHGHRCRVVVYC